MSAPTFAALVQGFFTDRLLRQMRASPNTVSGDRDAFRLLIRYATDRLGKVPSDLTLEDLDPSLVIDFLDHLEVGRGTPRSRRPRRRPSF
jgi:integrase/recombinase XerD